MVLEELLLEQPWRRSGSVVAFDKPDSMRETESI